MDWLYKLVMVNMVPGACFQRRRACLDIVQALLETIIFLEEDSSKKGKAQCMCFLLKTLQKQGERRCAYG